jgi:hypothetical protein
MPVAGWDSPCERRKSAQQWPRLCATIAFRERFYGPAERVGSMREQYLIPELACFAPSRSSRMSEALLPPPLTHRSLSA